MILLVDDFKDGLLILQKFVEREGYASSIATSGQEALTAARAGASSQPLLLVLDYLMPGMSGLEVLRRLKADPSTSRVNVVMYSAVEDDSRRDEAMKLGALAWITKGHVWKVDEICKWYERIGGRKASTN